MKEVCNLIARFRRDESGVIAIVVALMLPVLIGFVAVGIDVGSWYVNKRIVQNTVDAAVIAAIHELSRSTIARARGAALTAATSNGYNPAGGDTITINMPPASGPNAGDNSAIEVLVTRTPTLYFAQMFLAGVLTIQARAVAALVDGGAPACMLALDPTASGAIDVGGTADVEARGCQIQVNSTNSQALTTNGKTTLSAQQICVSGGFNGPSTSFAPQPEPLCSPLADPLAGLVPPSDSGLTRFAASVTKMINKDTDLGPGVYEGRISVTAGAEVTFLSGVYFIEAGGIDLKGNASIIGNGVTFVLRGDSALDFGGGGEVRLSATTTGPLKGFIFFQDVNADAGVVHKFAGGSNTTLEGTAYFRDQDIEFVGNAGGENTGPFVVVARRIKFTGTSKFVLNSDFSNSSVPPPPGMTKQVLGVLE